MGVFLPTSAVFELLDDARFLTAGAAIRSASTVTFSNFHSPAEGASRETAEAVTFRPQRFWLLVWSQPSEHLQKQRVRPCQP